MRTRSRSRYRSGSRARRAAACRLRRLPRHSPQHVFCAFAAEAAVSLVVPDMSARELRFWQDDQAINHRGVRVDMESVHNCIAIFRQAERKYTDEMATLTEPVYVPPGGAKAGAATRIGASV